MAGDVKIFSIYMRYSSSKRPLRSRSSGSTLNLAKKGYELFCKNYTFGEPLRSVGLRAINLKSEKTAIQQDIFGNEVAQNEQELLEDSLYEVRKKFRKSSIKRATVVNHELNDIKKKL